MKTVKLLPTLALGGLLSTVLADPVTLPDGDTITGVTKDKVESFLGIPYADPPVAPLGTRLKPPVKLSTRLGDFNATTPAKKCRQGPIFPFQAGLNSILEVFNPSAMTEADEESEDCLTVTVQRPAGTTDADKLPVFFWIFGGGFVGGSTQDRDATIFINASMHSNQPFIFVAVNYRLAGWGFLPGAEILNDGSANLGLLDQRMGLEWVADNIASFGGDPDRVTIWGQSSGSISVFDQLVLYDGDANYNGKPLFRAAILSSGSITPVDPVDCPKGQAVYDQVVTFSQCDTQDDADTLTCLRNLSDGDFTEAVNSLPAITSYNSLALSYLPRPDGKALTASPDVLAKNGKIHAVPMILGNQEDEGVLFVSLSMSKITTTEELVQYLTTLYFHNADESQITEFVDTYSTAPEDGSPFRQGCKLLCQLFPARKRVGALLGDIVFNLIRRIAINIIHSVKPDLPIWSYLASYNHDLGGTLHGSDLAVLFAGSNENLPTASGRAYFLNFLYNLDPNIGTTEFKLWPKWAENEQLLWFNKTEIGCLPDDYRNASYAYMVEHVDILRF